MPTLERHRKEIEKRLRMLDKLLEVKHTVHPPGCNCAIMSRDQLNHMKTCPYRMLKELAPMIRASVNGVGELHDEGRARKS